MRIALIVALMSFGTMSFCARATAAPPSTCGLQDRYSKALCAYQLRNFADAAASFGEIAAKKDDPAMLRATYFLARTEMKLGRFDEASTLLIRIYGISSSFYREWNCDFLLGECRKATGKG